MSVSSAKIDTAKLNRSIKKYAKAFGESSAQAVTRWSVQTCRELAKYSQPFKGGMTAHRKSMWKDALHCVIPIEGKSPKGAAALKTPLQIMEWVDLNRTMKGRRVPKLPINQRKKCSMTNLKKAIKIKSNRGGIAKGGWIGAGDEIAKNQTGLNKFNIGSNFIKYAHNHSYIGIAKPPPNGFKPVAEITNQARHSGNDYVLRTSQIDKAISDGRRKCLKFYKIVLNKLNKNKR
jgi:hypothetical protein